MEHRVIFSVSVQLDFWAIFYWWQNRWGRHFILQLRMSFTFSLPVPGNTLYPMQTTWSVSDNCNYSLSLAKKPKMSCWSATIGLRNRKYAKRTKRKGRMNHKERYRVGSLQSIRKCVHTPTIGYLWGLSSTSPQNIIWQHHLDTGERCFQIFPSYTHPISSIHLFQFWGFNRLMQSNVWCTLFLKAGVSGISNMIRLEWYMAVFIVSDVFWGCFGVV